MSWTGRVAVITGAASGIGQALAVDLAKRGAAVALCDVNDEGLAETASRVERLGRRATTGHVDVSDRAAVEAFRDRVLSEHGRVDAIVNNAGVTVNQSVAEMTYDDFEWIMGINFWGVVYGTKAYLPHLLERNDGWVVNVSSVFGIIGYPYQSAYNATKFAVRGFTESLRHELAETGVTSLCVHPGGIKTNIVRSSRFRGAPDGSDKESAVKRFDTKAARTTAEEAAKIIADAMDAKKDRVLVGPDAVAIDAIQRVAPVGYGKLLAMVEKRARGEG